MKIIIKKGNIKDIVEISHTIPEFDNPYKEKEYKKRLSGVKNLILIACNNDEPVGFKVGYDRFQDGSFYSWMGGILPEFRRKNIAHQLALEQEKWAKENGFIKIVMKTLNKHKAMLQFAISRNFKITGFEENEDINKCRIWLKKKI